MTFRFFEIVLFFVSTNKVLLNHRQPHLCRHCLWLLLHDTELNSCHEDCMAHKAYNVDYLAIYKKSLPTPTLHNFSFNMGNKQDAIDNVLKGISSAINWSLFPHASCCTTSPLNDVLVELSTALMASSIKFEPRASNAFSWGTTIPKSASAFLQKRQVQLSNYNKVHLNDCPSPARPFLPDPSCLASESPTSKTIWFFFIVFRDMGPQTHCTTWSGMSKR